MSRMRLFKLGPNFANVHSIPYSLRVWCISTVTEVAAEAKVHATLSPLLTKTCLWHATGYECRCMAQIKVSIGKMPVPKKIQFVRQIVQEMSRNGKFNSPSPDLATLAEAATAVESAYNAAQAARANAKEQTRVMNKQVNALENLVMQEASYVQSVSRGDK